MTVSAPQETCEVAMYSRPRRLFQEIGHKTGTNWLRQPRSHMILVHEDRESPSPLARQAITRGEPIESSERLQ
jgi:hypothetical protein